MRQQRRLSRHPRRKRVKVKSNQKSWPYLALKKRVTLPAVPENNLSEADTSVESRNQLLGSDMESDVDFGNNPETGSDEDAVMTPAIEREVLERRLRKLSIEEKLNELKKKKKDTVSKRRDETVFRYVRVAPSGQSQLGTYNGLSDLDTFLSRFNNCVGYYHWTIEDQLFQLKNSLIDAAGYVVTEAGTTATLEEIVQLLKVRFGNEHQAERFRAEMRSRRRRAGEPLQTLYQDLCRLKLLAFGHSQETEFSKLYLRDVFLDSLNDLRLRKLILIQEPHYRGSTTFSL